MYVVSRYLRVFFKCIKLKIPSKDNHVDVKYITNRRRPIHELYIYYISFRHVVNDFTISYKQNKKISQMYLEVQKAKVVSLTRYAVYLVVGRLFGRSGLFTTVYSTPGFDISAR